MNYCIEDIRNIMKINLYINYIVNDTILFSVSIIKLGCYSTIR